jgi:hypothetical protein
MPRGASAAGSGSFLRSLIVERCLPRRHPSNHDQSLSKETTPMSGELFNNLTLKTFTSFEGGRDDLGTSISLHSAPQRTAYLRRNPTIDPATLPPVRDPAQAQHVEFGSVGSVHGLPVRTPSRIRYEAARETAALLVDPSATLARREPTRPNNPEPEISLYRTAIHEIGHLICAFAFDVPVARISLVKHDGALGHLKLAPRPDSEQQLAILLGGRAAEIVEFGCERTVGCETDMQDALAMANRLASDDAEELLQKTLARVVDMLRREKKVVRHLAYELINKREIDFEDIDAAIDRAFTRADAAVKGRTYHMNNPRDLADWNAKQGRKPDAEPLGTAPGYIAARNK